MPFHATLHGFLGRHSALLILAVPLAIALEETEIDITSAIKTVTNKPFEPGFQDRVLRLNQYTLNGTVLQTPTNGRPEHWIVSFCPSWWEPCQKLEPIFTDLALQWQGRLNTALLSVEVRFAKVDCATDKPLCNQQQVETYPTVFHYHRGKQVAGWSGSGRPKDSERLNNWLKKQLDSAEEGGPSAASSDVGGMFTRYLKPGERAVDLLLIIVVLALNFWVISGNPELWRRGPRPEGTCAEPSRPPAAPPGGEARRRQLVELLPEDWACARSSIEL